MKTILITGASRGIGRATARLCGARGWSVAVNYARDEAAAEATVADVIAAGGKARAIRADVAHEDQVHGLFDIAEAALGPLSGVVNNAGIVAEKAMLAEMTAERMRRVFDTNVMGAFLVAREAARRMPPSQGGIGGSIVNISSVAAKHASPFEYVDYAASKGAVDTMTKGLALELARESVRVNAVRPGLIETEIHASGGQPDRVDRLRESLPMARAGTPEEVAEAVVWLLDDASSYVTGALLDVGGGR